MSSTTPATANRLGINRGWTNDLTPQNFYLTDMLQITYLKSYLLLKEYLRFQQINLLTFDIKTVSPYKKVIYLTIYQHLLYEEESPGRVLKLEYLWFDPFAIHQNLNYKKLAISSFASKKITKENKVLRQISTQKFRRKFKLITYFSPKKIAKNRRFWKKRHIPKIRFVLRSLKNIKKNRKFLKRKLLSLTRKQKKRRKALLRILRQRKIEKKHKSARLWRKKWSKMWITKYVFCFKLKRGKLKNKIKRTWLHLVRHLFSALVQNKRNTEAQRFKQNGYYTLNLPQFLAKQTLKGKLESLTRRSFYKWREKKLRFRWRKNFRRQSYIIYDNEEEDNEDEESYTRPKDYTDKHVENIMLRDIFTNKISNIHLKLFLECYLFKCFGLSCIVKFNQTSDSVYTKRINTSISSKNSELHRIKQFNFFKRLAFMFINAQRNIDAQMVADLIAREVELTREYKHFCHNIDLVFQTFMPRYLKGYRILISGKTKLHELRHSSELISYQDKDLVPRKQFNKRVIYALGVARNKRGVFGIKVWLHY